MRDHGPTIGLQTMLVLSALAAAACGGGVFDESELLNRVQRAGTENAPCPDYLGASTEGETQRCFRTALNPDEFVRRLVNLLPAPDGFDLQTGFDWVRESDVRLQGGCVADVVDSSLPYPYAGGEALFGIVDRRRCDDGVWVVLYTAPSAAD